MNIKNVNNQTCRLACFFILAVVLFSAGPRQTVSAQDEVGFSASTKKFILDNGMTVLITEVPDSTTAGLYAFVRAGAATEGKYLGTGVSHFLEHMLFKGTDKRPVGAIGQEVKALGGSTNASTGYDYTFYYIELPKENYLQALDILADMLMHSKFDPKETESEREVVISEMRMHNDSPDRKVEEWVLNTAYTRHPYRHPVIGYETLFKQLTRDDIWDYYQQFYAPNNIVFSIAGDLNTPETLEHIKTAFKDFKPKPYISRNLPKEPRQIAGRYFEGQYPTDMTRLRLEYQGMSILDEDLFALDVLAMVLGRGRSSRLYQELYEKKRLVYSVHAGNDTPMDQGLFEVGCALDDKNIPEVIKTVKEQIQLIKTKGVREDELEKAKRQVYAEFIFDHQRPAHLAYQAASDEVVTGDHQFSKNYVQGIRSVTGADIQRVIPKYFADEHLTTVILRPQIEKPAGFSLKEKIEKQEIQKIVLDNGLTILLKEKKDLPIVSVNLALNGGMRMETVAKNGLSELTSRLWARETKTRSKFDLSKMIEEKAMSFGAFSGRNSVGLRMEFLSEDLDFGLDLLEDVIKNPLFSEAEFLKEKEKIKQDIIAKKDSVSELAVKTVKETLFQAHYFRLDNLGTAESIDQITHKDVIDFYSSVLSSRNMVLSIIGDINARELIEKLKKKFGGLASKEVVIQENKEPAPEATRKVEISSEKEQAILVIGFQGPVINSPDRHGVEMITSILGSSLSGRMFNKIRDELGQAYTLGVQYVPGIDMGLIYFYVNTTNENLDKVEDILRKQLDEIRTSDISDQELTESRAQLKGDFEMDLETNASLGFTVTLDELYGLGYAHYKTFHERTDAVTKEDIRRIAQDYLDINKAAVVKLRAKEDSSPKVDK